MSRFRSLTSTMAQRPLLVVTTAYTAITILVTYPLILNMTTGLGGLAGDSLQHLWSLWWGKKAFLDLGTSLADISYLYYPQSVQHGILGVTPVIQILAAPLVWLFGPVFTYNLGLMLATIFSGVTTYLLAYEVTQNRLAAFVGGLVFAFAPTRLMHSLGHYAQIMTFIFPLYTLFLVRSLKTPTWRLSAITGILLGVAMLVNFVHVAYFVIPVTLILVSVHAWQHWNQFRQWRQLGTLTATAVIGFVITAPFFLPFLLRQASGTGLSFLSASGVSELGADALALFSPSPFHPALQDIATLPQSLYRITGPNTVEGIVYLGMIPLLLTIIGFWHQRRRGAPWLVITAITLFMSLGPFLKVNGEFVTYAVDGRLSYILMPYAVLTELPIFEYARTPARLNGTTMLGLAVLASMGVATLLTRPFLAKTRAKTAFLSLLVPLMIFEYLTIWPFPIAQVDVPEFYQEVRAEAGDFAILDYPVYLFDSPFVNSPDFPMYYQTVHERPIVGGYIWRLPPGADGTMRAMDNLVSPDPIRDVVPLLAPAERVDRLRALNIRYVVVHKFDTHHRSQPMPQAQLQATRAHLNDLLGTAVYEDEYILAYRVPAADTATAPSVPLLLAPGRNWRQLEGSEDGIWRWATGQEVTLNIYGRVESRQRLIFTARSADDDVLRHVELLVNGEPIGDLIVGRLREFVTPPFMLTSEQNQITLRFQEPCSQFPTLPGYCLSLRARDIRLVSEATLDTGETAVQCDYGQEIRLLGYTLSETAVAPGASLTLTLYWQGLAPISDTYTIFTHLTDRNQDIISQQDNPPRQGTYQTNWWHPGEIVADDYTLTIPEEAAAGAYQLSAGLYSWPAGTRLALDDNCAWPQSDNAIILEQILIEE